MEHGGSGESTALLDQLRKIICYGKVTTSGQQQADYPARVSSRAVACCTPQSLPTAAGRSNATGQLPLPAPLLTAGHSRHNHLAGSACRVASPS